MTINELIIYEARKWLGQREIKGNAGFVDARFQELMKEVGWMKGQSWCAYFSELVWKSAYSEHDKSVLKQIDKLFSAGAVATWNQFYDSEFVCDQDPEPGCIVIWQMFKTGSAHWTGHAGIVLEVHSESELMTTIEGNTNQSGGREGIEVGKMTRPLDFREKVNGLVLLGFIHPKM